MLRQKWNKHTKCVVELHTTQIYRDLQRFIQSVRWGVEIKRDKAEPHSSVVTGTSCFGCSSYLNLGLTGAFQVSCPMGNALRQLYMLYVNMLLYDI